MIGLKYKVGDIITIKDGNDNGRQHLSSGKVKGKITEIVEYGAFHFNYAVKFETHIYLVYESEIIDEGIKVIFT